MEETPRRCEKKMAAVTVQALQSLVVIFTIHSKVSLL